MKLTAKELTKLTALTKISFSEADLKKIQSQMSDILTFVDQLKEVAVSEVGVVKQINGAVNHWREDLVSDTPVATRDSLIKAAPEVKEREIKVPGVFTQLDT